MELHILLIFILCSLILISNRVEGNSWKLSKEEELEVERELKLLNKQATKTIHTEYGAIYDCIDFHQQPAFDHPKLKNIRYRFKLEPTSLRNDTMDQVSSEVLPKFETCPSGTVVIRRLTKDDLIRQRLALKYTSSAANEELYFYAVTRTKPKPNRYSGAGIMLDVCNPKVYERDYSSARVLLRNGPDSIEAGWKVDPYLHGENWPYFYLRSTANNFGVRCFHSLCSGFVVTSTTAAPDGRPTVYSERGKPHYSHQVDILRDPNGNWKLRYGPYDKYEIGFWPKEIFAEDGLAQMASYVDYGGEVFSQPYTPMPAMGIGFFPNLIYGDSSSVGKLTYRDESGVKVMATDLELFSNSDAYRVIQRNAQVFLYGGPGGNIPT